MRFSQSQASADETAQVQVLGACGCTSDLCPVDAFIKAVSGLLPTLVVPAVKGKSWMETTGKIRWKLEGEKLNPCLFEF